MTDAEKITVLREALEPFERLSQAVLAADGVTKLPGIVAESRVHRITEPQFQAAVDALAATAPTAVPPGHASDCAVHRAPAYPPGPCDCGLVPTAPQGAVEAVARDMAGRGDPRAEWSAYATAAEAAIITHHAWLRENGWVVVRREPTEAMQLAGLVALCTSIEAGKFPLPELTQRQRNGLDPIPDEEVRHRYMNLGAIIRHGGEVIDTYRAMIAAAEEEA